MFKLPRTARAKAASFIYHIIVRSISEIELFKDENDKIKFMHYLKRYKIEFNFKIYAYCLMNNHVHLIIDANGADISKIMHGINQSYAQYFNRKYKRHGHLFQDRFKSKVVSNERYLKALSIYIHNNPTDIVKYKNSPEGYKYSSLGIYLGLREDDFNIVEYSFILELFGNTKKSARKNYIKFICRNKSINLDTYENRRDESTELQNKELRKIIYRDIEINKILDLFLCKINISKNDFFNFSNRDYTNYRAVYILMVRNLCHITFCRLSSHLNNLSQSYLSYLKSKAIDFININRYKDIYDYMVSSFQ